MKHLLLISLVLLLAACGTPESSTPAPTPEAINLMYPDALQPWADKLGACASDNPLVGLYFIPSPISKSPILANEIVLELGNPSPRDESSYVSQIGLERIVVVTNQANKLSQLTIDELRSIYSGQTLKWGDGIGQPIKIWVFPIGDPIRMVFDQAVMEAHSITTEAMLAPDPGAMLEAVSEDASAIGYLPESFITSDGAVRKSKVKIIPLVGSAKEQLHQPVLAMTQTEPQGLMRDLLVCLQGKVQ